MRVIKSAYYFLFLVIFLFPIDTFSQWEQIGEDIDGENEYEYFGRAMTMSGDGTVVAIGTQSNPENGFLSYVEIYKNIDETWTLVGEKIDAASGDNSDAIVLNFDGSIVAIGSIRNGSGDYSGHTRVFRFTSGVWQQIGNEILGTGNENAGSALSLNDDGSVLAIGAHFNDENGMDAGQIRIYANVDDSWEQIGEDINGDGQADNFGFSVDLNSNGSVVAVGALFNDNNSGQVKVFKRNNDNWEQIGEDILGGFNNVFGYSVSLSEDGSILAVGAIGNVNTNVDGYFRVFQNVDNNWQQIGNDVLGESPSDYFGASVSLSASGTIVAVGAESNDQGATDAGYVQVYEWSNNEWSIIDDDIVGDSEGDSFGRTVSLSSDGSTVASSGFLDDDAGFQAGHVRVFKNENIVHVSDLFIPEIVIFPNPSNGYFIIENTDSYHVDVVDVGGNSIFKKVIGDQSTSFDLEDRLSCGVYFVNFQNNTHSFALKLVVF